MANWLLDKLNLPSLSGSKKHSNVPEGLWKKCVKCGAMLYQPKLEEKLDVCPKCDYHMRISAKTRLDYFLDPDNREEIAADLEPEDRLKFKDSKKYRDRLNAAQKQTGQKDALLAMKGTVKDIPIAAVAFEFSFMGGSMGSVVGEKFVQAVNVCLEERCALVCFAASGGARMQEALFSLMQMAKTSAALEKLKASGLPFISVLTDPVYGGVSASLAMLGDINIAEPNALIGFAGPRVIEQTVREKLPEGFQRSEFLLEHGTVDMILQRSQLRDRIASLLDKMTCYFAVEAANEPISEEVEPTQPEEVTSEEAETVSEQKIEKNTEEQVSEHKNEV